MTRSRRSILSSSLLLGSVALAGIAPPVHAQVPSLQERLEALERQRLDRPAAENDLTPARLLQKLYFTELALDFERTPITEAIDYLAEVMGVRIVARTADDRVGHGLDPELRITLRTESITALTALEYLLEVASTEEDVCTWQLRRGYIEVGTKDRLAASAAQELRSYPLDDLLMVVPTFDNAPSLDLRDQLGIDGYSGWGMGGGYHNPRFPGSGGIGFPGQTGGGFGGAIIPGQNPRSRPMQRPAENREQHRRARAEEIITLITTLVEPGQWRDQGGDWAGIAYYDGLLLIRAPDFIHRQIAGYPRVEPPESPEPTEAQESSKPAESPRPVKPPAAPISKP